MQYARPSLTPTLDGTSERIHPFATTRLRWLEAGVGGLLAMSPDKEGIGVFE